MQGIVRDALFIELFLQQGQCLGAVERQCGEVVAHRAFVQAQVETVAVYADHQPLRGRSVWR